MTQIATHDGVVVSVNERQVSVKIETMSACGHCEAKGKCGFAESKERTVEIETAEWKKFRPGMSVEVQVNQSKGMEAVWWAYLLPAVLLVVCVITLLQVLQNELLAVLITLLCLALYVGVLYLCRKKFQSRFSFNLVAKE